MTGGFNDSGRTVAPAEASSSCSHRTVGDRKWVTPEHRKIKSPLRSTPSIAEWSRINKRFIDKLWDDELSRSYDELFSSSTMKPSTHEASLTPPSTSPTLRLPCPT
jgi:hypothetical protein